MPGARKTPGIAIGRSLQPSPDEWAVRNRELTNNLVELINDHAPEMTHRALDVGCQWGVMLDNLAQRTSPRWWGADPVVERHFSKGGFELVNGTADDLPFADASFDCIVLANVYEHIPPAARDASLVEMRRVLMPGGVIVGQLPNPHFPIESHSKLPFMGYLPARAQNAYWRVSPSRRGAGFHSVTVGHLTRRARAAGLDVALVRNYTYPPEAAPDSIRWFVRAARRPMSILPWSWQFVLRRPATDGAAASDGDQSKNIYCGDQRWFGIAEDDITASSSPNIALANWQAFRAGRMELPVALAEVLATDDHADTNMDAEVEAKATELAYRVPANYRGPEWQWMQEALVRLAAQAGSRTPDSPLAGPLTMETFRTRL
jgi:SAM-dependent methyltransferase